MTIETRHRMLVNTDPQRRCYNGCYFSSELIWSDWEVLEYTEDEERLEFWKDLNNYAVSQRGESARREFRIVHRESERCDVCQT